MSGVVKRLDVRKDCGVEFGGQALHSGAEPQDCLTGLFH